MEHLAVALNMPSPLLKQLNFYKKGQVTPYGEQLPYFNIPTIWEQLQDSADYTNRLSQVQAFNQANRWVKRGLSLVPIKFGLYLDVL
jgi:xanthine dehydrogenase/oxidase